MPHSQLFCSHRLARALPVCLWMVSVAQVGLDVCPVAQPASGPALDDYPHSPQPLCPQPLQQSYLPHPEHPGLYKAVLLQVWDDLQQGPLARRLNLLLGLNPTQQQHPVPDKELCIGPPGTKMFELGGSFTK